MEEREEQTSKFSSGLNIVMRLDELWKDSHTHARNGLYSKWNLDLDRIWLELSRDYKEEDEGWTEKEKKFNEFDTEIKKQKGFHDKKPEGFKKIEQEIVDKRDEVYKILMKKQLFLARLENELGKGTTFEDGDDDDFD